MLLVALVAAIVFLEINVPRMIASLGGAACAYFVLADVALAAAGRDGGRLGGALHAGLRALVGDAGAWIVLVVAALAITVAITGVSLKKIIGWTIARARRAAPARGSPPPRASARRWRPSPPPALREAFHLPALLPRRAPRRRAGSRDRRGRAARRAIAAVGRSGGPVPTQSVVERTPRWTTTTTDERSTTTSTCWSTTKSSTTTTTSTS